MLNGRSIVVSGGKIEPGFVDNDETYVLDVDTLVWSNAT